MGEGERVCEAVGVGGGECGVKDEGWGAAGAGEREYGEGGLRNRIESWGGPFPVDIHLCLTGF